MPSSDEVLATIPVGMVPKWVAIGPGGTRAYVTMSNPPGSGPPEGAVAKRGADGIPQLGKL
jgi:hypothetical protein